jgi:hypothetical protein
MADCWVCRAYTPVGVQLRTRALVDMLSREKPVYGHDEFLRRLLIHSAHAKVLPPGPGSMQSIGS